MTPLEPQVAAAGPINTPEVPQVPKMQCVQWYSDLMKRWLINNLVEESSPADWYKPHIHRIVTIPGSVTAAPAVEADKAGDEAEAHRISMGNIERGSWNYPNVFAATRAALARGRELERENIDHLTRALDVALHGEADAAKQASLCDLIEPVRSLTADRDRLAGEVAKAEAELYRVRTECTAAAHQLDNLAIESGFGHSLQPEVIAEKLRDAIHETLTEKAQLKTEITSLTREKAEYLEAHRKYMGGPESAEVEKLRGDCTAYAEWFAACLNINEGTNDEAMFRKANAQQELRKRNLWPEPRP
jgi:hypothetical protein